jgi:hypothetical protein
MHPAGEHFNCDRLGTCWAYLLQVAAFDLAGELGQRSFQDIQIADHAAAVELLAVHHDLNSVVMIMQLPLWPGQSRHDMESTDASAQPDFTRHRRHPPALTITACITPGIPSSTARNASAARPKGKT